MNSWGRAGNTFGTGDGEFDYPHGVAVDAAGDVYVVDTENHRVQKFSKTGTFKTKWGSLSTTAQENGRFRVPFGIATDGFGRVYVTDKNNHRVQRFQASDGQYFGKFGTGTAGGANGQFRNPGGVAVDDLGRVYVADTWNHRVQLYSGVLPGQGNVRQGGWGSYGTEPGKLDSPWGIAVDAAYNVYVADTGNGRVQKFTRDGALLAVFDIGSSAMGVAVSADGLVYVGTSDCKLKVFGVPAKFTSSPKAKATAGKRYSSSVKASGVPKVSSFTVVKGKLPPGVKLNKKTGKLTGTPTKAGTYKPTIRAGASGLSRDKQFTIKVAKAKVKAKATLVKKTVSPSAKAKVKVKVTVPKAMKKTAKNFKVTVYDGNKKIKTQKLAATKHTKAKTSKKATLTVR